MSNFSRTLLCFCFTLLLCGAASAQTTTTTPGATTPTRLTKWVNNAGSLGDSVVTESATGNIGIGTATPNNKLHIVGAMEVGATSGPGVNPTIFNPNNRANFSQVRFYPASGTNVNTSFSIVPRGTGQANNRAQFSVLNTDTVANPSDSEFVSLRARGADFVLGTGKTGAGLNRPLMFAAGFLSDNVTNNNQFVLATDGNVGVGTSAPGQKLDVAGNVKAAGVIESTSGGFKFPDNTVQLTAATPGMSAVTPDATLVGDGTTLAPLGVADGSISAVKLSAAAPQAGQVLSYDGASLAWTTPATSGGSGSGSGGSNVWVCAPVYMIPNSGSNARTDLFIFNGSSTTANVAAHILDKDGNNLFGVTIPGTNPSETYPGETGSNTVPVSASNTRILTWNGPQTYLGMTNVSTTIRVTSDQPVFVSATFQWQGANPIPCSQLPQ